VKNHKFLTYIFLFSLIFYFANLIKASGTIGENSRILGDNNLGKSKKCLIIYHSISGNTRRLAESLCAVLRNDYEVTTKELTRNLKSSENKMELYDLVAFGSPLHYGEFSPQMQDCILNATGLEGKKIILFVTYGTGSGRHNALLNQAVVLKNKGAAQIIKIAYPGEFTNKKNDMVNALKCALGENKNYVPTYAPLSDFYTSDTVILSGIVNYKENVLKNRARIIGDNIQ
jgi:flavodoxin